MVREIDSHMPPPLPNMLDLGPKNTGYIPIYRSETLTVSYLFVRLLVLLDSNCTILKDFSDSIRSLFLIIKFAVDACHFHINLIAYSVVMHDSLGVLSDIINV